ncbi:nickel-dependent hydrogenase large subunit [Corynebacterium frankenforstense]|uniref:nickel-dependent hydrogenase large subunit n=1 Tax=Corynebacterium frankenforstense TaxID=1230998 RepID=UPI00254A8ECC|nr:nickel-dependent hydrogenase large subunit [Corynebacterium frankenforstense]MDK6259094.1 nickel-dependent hydrogenase large subunit [Corynebacterium frankenforstense]
MTEKLRVDQLVDPAGAVVHVRHDAEGHVDEAAFDLSGFPRVDPMLVGRTTAEVPQLVTRLCGLCPVTHHLAAMRALDDLTGLTVPPRAVAVRSLLHHGSVLDTLAPKLLFTHRELAVELKRFGKQVLEAAGCPGHFPDVAVPGGVKNDADTSIVDVAVLADLRERAAALPGLAAPAFTGAADVFLCDADGTWDPLGTFFAVVAGDTREIYPVAEFPERVRESRPGATSPRPEVLFGGDWLPYRVGPAARGTRGDRFGVADSLDGVAAALDALGETTGDGALRAGGDHEGVVKHQGRGVGLVDGPRGLLAHVFDVDAEGTLTGCWILTPTAQNEPWLAAMLTDAARSGAGEEGMEQAIRTADPCLPCSSAPPGAMHVEVATMEPGEKE